MHLQVVLFSHGSAAFLELLREHNIDFVQEPVEPGAIHASGELLDLASIAIPSIATVLVAWLGARSKRKIILRAGIKTFHMEGYSLTQAKKALEAAEAAAPGEP